MTDTPTRRPKRGVWGRLWLTLFWVFNVTAAAMIIYERYFDSPPPGLKPIEVIGWGVGTAIVTLALLKVWLIGAVVLGILAFLTRGKRPLPPLPADQNTAGDR